jgi:lysozyme family protein
MATFEAALEFTLKDEGGYSNNPADPGGETYKGISRHYWPTWQGWQFVAASKAGLILDQAGIKKLDALLEQNRVLQQAVSNFYRKNFWNPRYEYIVSQSIATKIFNEAVNLGVEAVRCLQQALVAVGYPISIDGQFGGETIRAVNLVQAAELIPKFSEALSSYYIAEAEKTPAKKVFLAGWLKRAAEIPPE